MGKLYVMMGLPGSGKSTFLKNYFQYMDNAVIISRDDIRFSLLKENEPYFSQEKKVKKILWDTANKELSKGNSVFIDQTSLTKASRKLLLDHIDMQNCNLISLIWIDTALSCCLENNETRKGTKAYVPQKIIGQMAGQLEPPQYSEGFDFIYTYNIYNNTIKFVDKIK